MCYSGNFFISNLIVERADGFETLRPGIRSRTRTRYVRTAGFKRIKPIFVFQL